MHQIVESGRYRSRGLFQQPNRGPRGQERFPAPGAAGGFSTSPTNPRSDADVGVLTLNTGVPGVLLTRTLGINPAIPQDFVYVAFSLQTLIDLGWKRNGTGISTFI